MSRKVKSRWKGHLHAAASGAGHALHRAIRKYRPENFDFVIIEECYSLFELLYQERRYIRELNTNFCMGGHGYNLTNGGESIEGYRFNVEQKRKIALSRRGKPSPKSSTFFLEMWKNDEYRKKLESPRPSIEELSQLLNSTWSEISTKFNVSVVTVKKWFKIYGLSKIQTKAKTHRSWSQREDNVLIHNFTLGKTCNEIGVILNRSMTSILKRLQALKTKGLINVVNELKPNVNPKHKPWSPEEDGIIIIMVSNGRLLEEIAKILKRSICSVANRAGRIGAY